MTERRISYALEVENGERTRTTTNEEGNLDEYGALNRYISTARDGRRGSTSSAGARSEGGEEKKKPWWKFGGKKEESGEGFVIPEEWAETDMHSGLSENDVEPRRKKAGFNELTTEKTSFFLQFLGYFRGPILYGKSTRRCGSQHSYRRLTCK